RGDLRGEFIRIQCSLARDDLGHDERKRLEARERELLATFGDEWSGELLRRGVKQCRYSRGFVETIEIDAALFLIHGDVLFSLAPIRSVKLLNASQRIEGLAHCPHLHRLHSLALSENELTDQEVILLANSPYVATLKKLILIAVSLRQPGFSAIV